jgi:ribonuclease III
MKPNSLLILQEKLDYTFKNSKLLVTALTHRSCLNNPNTTESYERLEFLGDAILEKMISVFLYNRFPTKMEGFLTAARSATVRTESLSAISLKYGFSQFILMSKGEEATGGRSNPSILEDVIESLIGALYIDGGADASQLFFEKFIAPNATDKITEKQLKDAKSLLQEVVQAKGKMSPVYQTLNAVGPDHNKIFEVSVFIDNKPIASGNGKNKQEAEQKAAEKALALINEPQGVI